jgi:hypothetical protein
MALEGRVVDRLPLLELVTALGTAVSIGGHRRLAAGGDRRLALEVVDC